MDQTEIDSPLPKNLNKKHQRFLISLFVIVGVLSIGLSAYKGWWLFFLIPFEAIIGASYIVSFWFVLRLRHKSEKQSLLGARFGTIAVLAYLVFVLTLPLFGDTDETTAFSFITTTTDSKIFTVSVIIAEVAFAVCIISSIASLVVMLKRSKL